MAKKRLTDPSIPAIITLDLADLIHVVDVSDTTSHPAGTSKKATINQIKQLISSYNDQFIELSDTPSTYLGQSLKIVRVKSDETGLEFATLSLSTPTIAQVLTTGNVLNTGQTIGFKDGDNIFITYLSNNQSQAGNRTVYLPLFDGQIAYHATGSPLTTNYVLKGTTNGAITSSSLIFDNGTNVGINQSSPSARLHVVGSSSASGAYALKIDNSSNSPLFCVQNDGTVGIGTISPVVKLQVEGLSYLNGGARITSVGIGGYWGGLANEILTLQATTGNPLILQYTEVGQIGIGTNAPNTSSILDIVSTNKGVLLPRMTTAQRNAISTPANGLEIYNTSTTSPNYYDGTTWQQVTNKAYVDTNIVSAQVPAKLFNYYNFI
jgi:hypothetical protein